MGVLDDAIREHLELKRKHGAPEQEVEQQAQEALGPVRGAPVEPPAQDDETLTEAPPTETPVLEEPAPVEDPVTEIFSEPAAPIEPEDETGEAEEATQDWEPPADDAGDEDVLEETPDFLQETPEHDRLWFEQKPPRDFDFDEE
jgi:hypothetical protein